MRAARFTAGRWLALSVGVLAVAALLSVGAAALAASRVTDARVRLADLVDPAQRDSLTLLNGMVDQETGVRGYLLGARDTFLEPYTNGARATAVPFRGLDALAASDAGANVRDDLALVRRRIAEWRSGYAQPAIERVRRDGPNAVDEEDVTEGKRRFDAVRAAFRRLDATLAAERGDARDDLDRAADQLNVALVFATVVLLGTLAAVAVIARNLVARPLGRLADQVRAVAGGALRRPVEPGGPKRRARPRRRRRGDALADRPGARGRREGPGRPRRPGRGARALQRRARAVRLRRLARPPGAAAQGHELLPAARAPLRGQLDERADQYIAFAVDGAKRMQILINDLLAFSRVGRMGRESELVDADDLVAAATANLAVGDRGDRRRDRGRPATCRSCAASARCSCSSSRT